MAKKTSEYFSYSVLNMKIARTILKTTEQFAKEMFSTSTANGINHRAGLPCVLSLLMHIVLRPNLCRDGVESNSCACR